MNACFTCNKNYHSTALCPRDPKLSNQTETTSLACLNTGLQAGELILPTITLRVRGHMGKNFEINFLVDSGSQRSYISLDAFKNLDCDPKLVEPVTYNVNTFLGQGIRDLQKVNIDVFTDKKQYYPSIIHVDA